MTRIIRSLIFCFSISLPGAPLLQARLFTPFPAPPPLEVDAQTEGLWLFSQEALASGSLPDTAKKSAPGHLLGTWRFVDPGDLAGIYPGAGQVVNGKGPDRSEATFSDLSALSGAFTIDVVLRWERGGGFYLRVGTLADPKNPQALAVGMLHRGPGKFELRVPVKTPGGKVSSEVFSSTELYNDPQIGPPSFSRFYTYSLSFDGDKTFRLFIDGRQAFQAVLATGTFAPDKPSFSVGDVLKWNDTFEGEVAAVRLSRGARPYQAVTASTSFSPQTKTGWDFDAGPASKVVLPGSIPLVPGDMYSARKGYGWLQQPSGDFSSWYMPGSFASTPGNSLKKGEHKVLDADLRDGVTVPSGDIFRADVPDGAYWVSVDFGNNKSKADVDSVSANGVLLGEALLTDANLNGGRVSERMARALVKVSGGQGIVISARAAREIPIRSIGIMPFAPLPIAFEGGALKWTSSVPQPAEFPAFAAAFVSHDSMAAIQAAGQFADPFVKACALSFALGIPKLPDPSDIAVSLQIRDLLLRVLQKDSANLAARWLFDSNERFRHALTVYIDERGTEVAYGSRFVLPFYAANLCFSLTPQDPEYWQARFLAAASLWQAAVQGSAFSGSTTDEFAPGKGFQAFPAPGRYFREVIAAYPDFRIARIMLGEKLPVAADWAAPSGCPQWAGLEHQLLQRILEVLDYWVNQRMDASGLLGGGLGDDVEALRWWGPSVLLADDADTIAGWKRMAATAWKSTGDIGYSRGMDDVEHSAEPTSDPLPMLALMDFDTPDMPATLKWLTSTTGIFRNLWTIMTPEGFRMFKGHHFSATQIEREGDVPYNIRAIRPLVWAAWAARGQYPDLDSALVEYARSWLDATMSEHDGKPAGLPPMMIMLDRSKLRMEKAKDWVFPGYWSYEYPGGYVAKVYELFLAAYEISGDKSFLEPSRFALEALGRIPQGDESPDKYSRPSSDWAVRIGAGMLGNAGANYRLVTGDQSFDDVLLRFGPSLTRYQILAARARTPEQKKQAFEPLEEKLSRDLAEMNSNPELRTVMVKSTDRIYVLGSTALSSYATGMPMSDADLRGNEVIWPMFSITWQGTDGKVSALVRNASTSSLEVLLYSLADKPLSVKPRLWRLAPGDYTLTLTPTDEVGDDNGQSLVSRRIKIEKLGQQIDFDLPAHTAARLSLQAVK